MGKDCPNNGLYLCKKYLILKSLTYLKLRNSGLGIYLAFLIV